MPATDRQFNQAPANRGPRNGILAGAHSAEGFRYGPLPPNKIPWNVYGPNENRY